MDLITEKPWHNRFHNVSMRKSTFTLTVSPTIMTVEPGLRGSLNIVGGSREPVDVAKLILFPVVRHWSNLDPLSQVCLGMMTVTHAREEQP